MGHSPDHLATNGASKIDFKRKKWRASQIDTSKERLSSWHLRKTIQSMNQNVLGRYYSICNLMWEHMASIKTGVESQRNSWWGGKLTEWDKNEFGQEIW